MQDQPDEPTVSMGNGPMVCLCPRRGTVGDSAEQPKFIETLPRRGYRFIGALDGIDPARVPAVPLASQRGPFGQQV
jgi:hypothetical protein